MECNCNNNNSNGGVIPWVRGNRLPLIICVYENVVTQEQVGDSTLTVNEMTRVPYTIQDNDTVTVIMKSGFRQVEMPFTTDGNKVMVTDNGELPKGSYTVEVTIEQGNGARGRWQETRQVRIYENTSDAQLGEMYSIDADLFFYAKGDTGTGIADITNNPDGTLTITMTDGTSYTTEALKGDKGDKGDTGERGTSIVSFDVTGQTDVSVIYTVTFSDDTTQDISVPKGPQGDTGLTGNGISTTTLNSDYTLTIAYTDGTTYTTPSIRGAQGAQGVSVIGFTQTGETATNTMYNLVFSDGRTQSVAIPKGVKGDKGDTGNTGPQGAQGPKGDTVTATDYTLYGVQGSDSQGAMSQDATTKAISAQTGYYTCGTADGTPEKVVTVESGNLYKRTLGGHFKVQMTNKNTAASGVTLQIGSETAAALWYNGAAVSDTNTWDADEVISVYYDGTYYQASNAQGGGGKAEKIKYDNSQSGLAANNVQEALDEVTEGITYGAPDQPLDLSSLTPQSAIIKALDNKWLVGYRGFKSVFLPITPTHQYKIKANASYQCEFAMLVSDTYTNGELAVFANGSTRTVIASGEEVIVTAGSNANYLWILTNGEAANTNQSPEYVAEYFGGVSTIKDKIEDIEEEIVDRTTIGDTPNEPIDLEQYTPSGIYIGDDRKWKINYSSFKGIIIPVTAGTTYKIFAGDNGASYALLPSNTYENEQTVTFCTGTGKSSVSANTSKIFIATSDANYMWIWTSYSNTVYTPKELVVYNGQEQINEYLDERRRFFTKTKVVVAASDSINPTEADYTCTGINDGAVIKQAISYALTNNIGTIHLKYGNYYLDTIDANNAFLTINLQNKGIIIEGEGYGRLASFNVTYNAYIALDDETVYKVVYISNPSRWAGALELENIDVKIPWNQKKIIGIDMVTFEGCISMQSVHVYGYNSLYASQVGHVVSVSNPPDVAIEGSIGIRTICKTPNGTAGNTFKNSGTYGFYEGWAINGEHLLCLQCGTVFNVYGYTFDHYANGAEQHPNMLLRCADERNVNGPRFYNNSKTQGILLIGFSFERKPDLAPGGQLGLAATEETPGQHRGIITYTMGYGTGSSSANSTTQPFWEDGHGHGMKTTNLSQLQSCSTSVRNGYKPNYLQRIWDTTLNKEVICIDEANKTWVDALGNIV